MQAAPLLFCLIVSGPLVAAEPKLSERLKTEVRTNLPGYTPPPDQPKDAPVASPGPTDPDVLVLPKVTVREKVQPRIRADDLLTPAAQDRKFAADYRKSLKGLDAVLNRFYIPVLSVPVSVLGPSPYAARGQAQYRAQQMADLNFVASARGADDPQNAGDSKKAAADMKQAIERQNRPAGGK